MTYHYHGIDAEESILTKSLPNLGTWALPNLFLKMYDNLCPKEWAHLLNSSLLVPRTLRLDVLIERFFMMEIE